ncbi:MAG: nucleoside-diphosphate sugar epimerase/dehydratase [Gammaproteobacteria bacterium]|nr:nucleoside-diphosphate sugar epimerase/dehydratase [Gammaproteobacteria bacterium]
MRRRLIALPRPLKQLILIVADTGVLLPALALSMWIAADNPASAFIHGYLQFPLAVLVALPLFAQAGIYRTIIRFPDSQLLLTGSAVLVGTAIVMAIANKWVTAPGFQLPHNTLPPFVALSLMGIAGSRLLMRALLLGHSQESTRPRTPVIIYGAGDAGMRLLSLLGEGARFRVVAVIDDNSDLHGRLLNGVRIWSPATLPRLARELRVRRVLLAMPSVSRARRQAIIDQLVDLNVRVQTVPDIADIISGTARVDDLREVDALDLLGRDSVPPDAELLEACITRKSVLVTGAGGSIGSELCRQIIQLRPERLVVLDMCELALYEIDRELRSIIDARDFDVELVTLLGSVHHRPRMLGVMQAYAVSTVYHAAAYKHVPIVEQNMVEGVHNNVIGTWHAAEAAAAAGVDTFVLVSTDKAVMPTSVMGATKRVAELVLQGMNRRQTNTRFCIVRFGNVLDSSGSVVPLFRDQILRGGPVTITHPDVTRYFMTIPEAAQLVIQASALGEGGDVFVLDMGEPVSIQELARRMIRLMGLSVRDETNPSGDIALEYTGLRPGEKLHEELLIGNNVSRTTHPMILRAIEESLPWDDTLSFLQALLAAANALDCERVTALLRDAGTGYQPQEGEVFDLTWSAVRAGTGAVEYAANLQAMTEISDRNTPTLGNSEELTKLTG